MGVLLACRVGTASADDAMDLREFQDRAQATDRTGANYENEAHRDVVVALLGIAGELGTLAATYKKYLRDGLAYTLHSDHLAEEIGDLLWYLAILATKFDLDLGDIANRNLEKVEDRWGNAHGVLPIRIYDLEFPDAQRLPRHFTVDFREEEVEGRQKAVMAWGDQQLGASLTDNTDDPDDYRFHDAFHLAFATILGWSPVIRKLMGRKRRADPTVDENQDGGRAIVIEEGIAALVFEYGADHCNLDGARAIDYELLRTVRAMTRRLEVKDQPARAWEEACRAGWKIFRLLSKYRQGKVHCDLDKRTIDFEL